MRVRGPQLVFVLTPPLLTMSLLAGIVLEQRTHLKPEDVEPYHARARQAIDAVPYTLGDGVWIGRDDEIPLAAQKLLRPNAILSRTYTENTPESFYRAPREASLLIVQCRDSRDMVGHYPPICYRAHGRTAEYQSPRDWELDSMTIPGIEYRFTHVFQGQTYRTTVYNFLIVPGRGIVRDIKSVEAAAEDYQQRHYGAAQFQVVFSGLAAADLTVAERDAIFATIMTPNITLIETLTSGGLQ